MIHQKNRVPKLGKVKKNQGVSPMKYFLLRAILILGGRNPPPPCEIGLMLYVYNYMFIYYIVFMFKKQPR